MHILTHFFSHESALITDPTWIFFLVLVIILFAPLLLKRLHIPNIIGLILAGILVGKYGLNLLERDSSFELFGQVGIYYIMFLAGLELDMGSVARYGRKGAVFGALTFTIPFILGYLAGHVVLGFGVATSLMLSCILASHTLVAYPIVGNFGMGKHKAVVVSVLATAIATLAALLALALVVGSQDPEVDAWHWVRFTLACLTYFVVVFMALPRLGRWFLRRYNDSVTQYIFILAIVFLSAALASLAGLEGLLGAFLAGLVVSRLVPRTSPLMTRIEFVGNALFIPYFLIGVGMLIDVRVLLSDMHTLWIVGVMVVTATVGKLIPAILMGIIERSGWASIKVMFGLTNAHAAGALAIVMIGTDPSVNLMDSTVLNGAVMVILFSCIISSLATANGARDLALQDTDLEENRGSYHGKCLVSYSRPDTVENMTQLAILIRNPWITDSLMGLSVDLDAPTGQTTKMAGKRLLEEARNIAASADVHMMTMSRVSTNVASGILHTMRENEVGELIVSLSDRETGMPKQSLGNVIDNVLSGSHREVMAVRTIVPPGTWRQVIVAVPQKAEYEVGFLKWVEHVCRIGEQLDCRISYYAHQDTLPHLEAYMKQKHPNVRTEFQAMNHWSSFHALAQIVGPDQLMVIVSARRGFISYAPHLSSLPQQIATHFSHTNVMLLYPDQWGEPSETLSIFAPNGQAVKTLSPLSLKGGNQG